MTAASPAVLKQLPPVRVIGVITKPFDIKELIDPARSVTADEKQPPPARPH